MNSRIAMILVETESVDNVGAVARAIKNMGLSDLRLVKPPLQWKEKGKKMAMNALDTLHAASVFPHLKEAIKDRHLVIGTTRRIGAKRGALLNFNEAIRAALQKSETQGVAFVFGKESKGLTNPDLSLCNHTTTIPSHPDYPSINLAQSVMLVAFSLFTQSGFSPHQAVGNKDPEFAHADYVSQEEIHSVLERFKSALQALDYDRGEGHGVIVKRIVSTLHGLIKRGGLLTSEAKMLKGLSRRIIEKLQIPIEK